MDENQREAKPRGRPKGSVSAVRRPQGKDEAKPLHVPQMQDNRRIAPVEAALFDSTTGEWSESGKLSLDKARKAPTSELQLPTLTDTPAEVSYAAPRGNWGLPPVETKVAAEQVFDDISEQFKRERGNYVIPTGTLAFDKILNGGIPLGQFIEVVSPSGLGKTTSMLHIALSFCSQGYGVLYIDSEKGITESQIQGLGLDPYYRRLFFHVKLNTYEEVERVINKAVYAGSPIKLVVIDSITTVIPAKLLEVSVEDVNPGIIARVQGLFLNKYKGKFSEADMTCIFVNQQRNKFVKRGLGFDVKLGSSGGNAFEYTCDVRIEMKRMKDIPISASDFTPIGTDALIWAFKNRFAQPFIKVPLSLYFGKGISNARTLAHIVKGLNLLPPSPGGWSTLMLPWGDIKVRGLNGAEEHFRANPEDYFKLVEYLTENNMLNSSSPEFE